MPSLPLFRRRDPWWESDGPAARRQRRTRALMGAIAFAAALVAFVGTAFVWSVELGIVAALGIPAALPFG